MAPSARASLVRLSLWLVTLLLLVVVSSSAGVAVAASTVGFEASFASASSPFVVTECDAACSSPGTVTLHLQLVRSGDLSATATVFVSTRASSDPNARSADASDDYVAVDSAPVVFAPSEATKTVTVTVVSDGVYEDDELFEAVVTSQSDGVAIDPDASVAYVKIVDGGDAGIFSFSASKFTFAEDAGLVQVHVARTKGASGAVTVTYRLANPGMATAINTKSFQLTDSVYQLTFEENQREASIPIRILNDVVYEAQEFFYLELSELSPKKPTDETTSIARLGATSTTVVFIADDGDAGRFDFAVPSIFCREDNGSAVVSIVRSLGASSSYTPVTLTVTTVGASGGSNATEGGSVAFDYLAASDKLAWANGETRKTFSVKIFNNKKYEPVTRAFKVRMTGVEGGASIGTQPEIWVYIVDDRDAGTLSFKEAQYTVLENAGSVTVEIVRTGLVDASGVNTYTSGAVTVEVATFAGTILPGKHKYDDDYDNGVVEARKCTHMSPCTAEAGVAYTALTSTPITFADGEKSKTLVIPILDDTLYEAPDQVFKVMLRNAGGGAHIGIDYEHPGEWVGYREALLDIDKRRNELPDVVGTIVTIQDDGDPAVLVSKASLSVSEIGQSDTVDIWLNAAPQADVTVELSCDADALTLSLSSITFTPSNWATRQRVVVRAVANMRTQGLVNSAIDLTVSSTDATYNAPLRHELAQSSGFTVGVKIYTQQPGLYDMGNARHAFPWTESFGVMTSPQAQAALVVFILDNDPAGVVVEVEATRHKSASTISPQNHVAVRRGGHKAVVRFSLASKPAGTVQLSLVAVANDGIEALPTSLTFTPSDWDTAQSVEIEAVASSKLGVENAVQYTSVRVLSSSEADPFYDQGDAATALTTIFVARYPAAVVLLDASVLQTRENDVTGAGFASYQVRLGSEPIHWEPEGSQSYKPFEVVLPASADTTLTLSSDAAVAAAAAGASATFSVAANASVSSADARMVRIGVLRFTLNPAIASATGSHQVGGATVRLYRLSGGENGGLGGVTVGVAVAQGELAEMWDETTLRADCASDADTKVDCMLRDGASPGKTLALSALFPTTHGFLDIQRGTAGETTIEPTGTFDELANAYVAAPGWIDIDVTVTVNAFLAKQHAREQATQPAAHELTLLVYSTTASSSSSFFIYDGASEVAFASKDHSDAARRPHLRVLASGRVNLARAGSASQSHAGNARAAIDGQMTATLGVASSFAMSSLAYAYPWWHLDLGAQRLVDDVVVTIKRKASAASMTATQLSVTLWLLLSNSPLAGNGVTNNDIAGLETAKANAKYAKKFEVVGRSFSAAETDSIVLRWRVFGAQGTAAFGDDHFHADYDATVEARYLLLQVDGDSNNIALIEVEAFQPALASATVSLGGFMPSPSVVRKGQNQIRFHVDQRDHTDADENGNCDRETAICRRELRYTSGDWWVPQTVRVAVVDDAVATGDRDILLTHTLQSADPSFHGTSVCSTDSGDASTQPPCKPGLFNESGVKPLRVLDDDENIVLFSTAQLQVEEGSDVSPNAPKVRRERRVRPASARCSTDPQTVVDASASSSCAVVFADGVRTSDAWETCITTPTAEVLAPGSAWVMAGFAETDITVTEITLTIPPMQGAKYVRSLSLWWSNTLDVNASTTSLFDISKGWTKIRSLDVALTSSGTQVIHTSDLSLASIKVLLVALEASYDESAFASAARCLVAPFVFVRARVALPFALAVRGDIVSADAAGPLESGRSRMHVFGKSAALQVRLASEPVADVTLAIVPDVDNAPLTVFDASSTSLAPVVDSLVGGSYESGEHITFRAPTTLVFTPSNWNVPQELTFLAIDDNTFHANRSFSVNHVITSTDETASVIPRQTFTNNEIYRDFVAVETDYAYTKALFVVATERQSTWPRYWAPLWISALGTVDITVVDDDLPGVTISTSVVVVSESAAAPANYSVALDSAPTGDVVVSISYTMDASLLTVSPLRLTFTPTNWQTPQFVFVTPVANDIYDAGETFTVGYDRLIAKASQPVLRHKVASANDDAYDALGVGGNEPTPASVAYVANQGVVAIVQDDDTGCPHEYACLNGGTCVNVTYGASGSASVCRCPATFGMRDCSADCANERDCGFSRVEFLLRCRAGDTQAICGDAGFSPSRLVATLYRMLTTHTLQTSSGKTFEKLSLAPMAESLYIVNATTAPCADATSSSGSDTVTCVQVTMDFAKAPGSTANPIVEKLQGYLETGSLQTQPLFAELLTATPQFPHNLSATVAVWIFVGFCAASLGGVATLMSVRYIKVKRFHVQPDLSAPGQDVTEPLTSSGQVDAQ